MMRKRYMRRAVAAAVGLAALGMNAAPAGAETFRGTFPAAGAVFTCESRNFTVTDGVIKIVVHEGSSRSGNTNITGTLTPQGVVAEDAHGNKYEIRGAFWFGGTYNAQQGTGQETHTGKFQIVEQGNGTVGSVNITFHVSPNEKSFDKNFGTCLPPSD